MVKTTLLQPWLKAIAFISNYALVVVLASTFKLTKTVSHKRQFYTNDSFTQTTVSHKQHKIVNYNYPVEDQYA